MRLEQSTTPLLTKIMTYLAAVLDKEFKKCEECPLKLTGDTAISAIPVGTTLWMLQREFILAVLTRNRGNRTVTAKELRISVRTLRNYMATMRLEGFTIPESDTTYYYRSLHKGEITIDTY